MKPRRLSDESTSSLYHNSTGAQSPHAFHVVGIGDAGVGLARGFFRVGDTEDILMDDRARFSMLAVDIEPAEDDPRNQLEPFREERNEFLDRLEDRGISQDKVHIDTVSLPVPDKDDLIDTLENYGKYLREEYPGYQDDPNRESWIPDDMESLVEKLENETDQVELRQPIGAWDQKADRKFVRTHRAVAKAIYGHHYYNTGIMADALDDFAESVHDTKLPNLVFSGFGVGGGTGSGMTVDLSRHLSTEHLNRQYPFIGLGVLPNKDDPEWNKGANLFTTLNEIDAMVDKEKRQAITDVWGELYRNPFTGGVLLIPTEHVMDRIRHYTEPTEGFENHWLKQGKKFIADTTAKYITEDTARSFYCAMKVGPQSELAAPHEKMPKLERSLNFLGIAKFAHPGVQRIPGDYNEEYRKDYKQSIELVRDQFGLPDDFETNYMDVSVTAPRWVWTDDLEQTLKDELSPWLRNGEDDMAIDVAEGFDTLTAYTQVLLNGIAKTDFDIYEEAREAYNDLPEEEKLLHHSFLLEHGLLLSEPSEIEGRAGKAIWDGSSAGVDISYEDVVGRGEVRPSIIPIMKEQADAIERAKTPTASDD